VPEKYRSKPFWWQETGRNPLRARTPAIRRGNKFSSMPERFIKTFLWIIKCTVSLVKLKVAYHEYPNPEIRNYRMDNQTQYSSLLEALNRLKILFWAGYEEDL